MAEPSHPARGAPVTPKEEWLPMPAWQPLGGMHPSAAFAALTLRSIYPAVPQRAMAVTSTTNLRAENNTTDPGAEEGINEHNGGSGSKREESPIHDKMEDKEASLPLAPGLPVPPAVSALKRKLSAVEIKLDANEKRIAAAEQQMEENLARMKEKQAEEKEATEAIEKWKAYRNGVQTEVAIHRDAYTASRWLWRSLQKKRRKIVGSVVVRESFGSGGIENVADEEEDESGVEDSDDGES